MIVPLCGATYTQSIGCTMGYCLIQLHLVGYMPTEGRGAYHLTHTHTPMCTCQTTQSHPLFGITHTNQCIIFLTSSRSRRVHGHTCQVDFESFKKTTSVEKLVLFGMRVVGAREEKSCQLPFSYQTLML